MIVSISRDNTLATSGRSGKGYTILRCGLSSSERSREQRR